MAILNWIPNQSVPDGMKITQVYGLVFNENGRLILYSKIKNGKRIFCPAGGTPESFDKDMVATLKRELAEEINITIKDDIHYIGYQYVDEENGKPPYAQVRMIAKLDKIGPKQPDPDNGETYDRVLASPNKVKALLNWGDNGARLIDSAVEAAKNKWDITIVDDDEEIWV